MAQSADDGPRTRADPARARRDFGTLVRRVRLGEAAPSDMVGAIEQTSLAKLLGFSETKFSRIETGRVGVSDADTEAIIHALAAPDRHGALRLTAADADELRRLAPLTRQYRRALGVRRAHVDYVDAEAECVELAAMFDEVPGSAQTLDTARAALARLGTLSEKQIEAQAHARANRSSRIFREGGPVVRLFLGQNALMREVGGPRVLAAQLTYLLNASELPNVSLRIVEWHVGSVPGLSQPFTLLHLPPTHYPPARRALAFDATLRRAHYTYETGEYESRLAQGARLAAGEADSRLILASRIKDLDEQ